MRGNERSLDFAGADGERVGATEGSGDAVFGLGVEEECFRRIEGESDRVVESGSERGAGGDGDALIAEAGVDDIGGAHRFDDFDGGMKTVAVAGFDDDIFGPNADAQWSIGAERISGNGSGRNRQGATGGLEQGTAIC